MKYLLALSTLLPFLTRGQVKLDQLITKRGLSYEMAGRAPYTGKAYSSFPNGDTQTVVTYRDGVPDGEIVVWYDKDHKQLEGFLDKGQKTGKYTWYYPNGQKQQEGYLNAGVQDSSWSEWYANGKQKMTGHYTDLVKNGDWTYWDEQGNLTEKKTYQQGLVTVAKDNFDTYLEKMEYYLEKRNYKEALKNADAAEAMLTAKTDSSQQYMNVQVYRSKCHSFAFQYRLAEKILLDCIGLTPAQEQVIQNSHLDKSPVKINQVIGEINKKEEGGFKTVNHMALAVCYNILGDSANFQQQQQIALLKGGMKDYIVNISLELYRLAGLRTDNYQALQNVNARIAKEGATERLELEKVQALIGNEKFEEAQKIVDKYLKKDEKNVTVLLSKAALETAMGDYEKRTVYEDKALAIDPNALSGTRE